MRLHGALLTVSLCLAQDATSPDPNMPRPIDGIDSVFIEELTWMEVRDAMRGGAKTVLVPSGGVEMNGPYLATGKHNYILRGTSEAIARKLGRTLVAPVIPFVPEGNIDPPTSHMRYPGTISVTEQTFKMLLTDIAASLKQHGFEHILFIADSGGNVKGMREVAAELSTKWKGSKTTIHYIAEYYDYPAVTKWLESQGVKQVSEGHHDDFAITSQMMVVDPTTVRMKERMAKGKFSINGVALAPASKSIAMGRKVIDHRAEITVAAARRALGQ